MIENGKTEIIKEIQDLIQGAESFKEELNLYCDLMKQMFLKESGVN